MIRRIRHKGLKLFYETGDASRLNRHHLPRIRLILTRLDASSTPDDMDLPGFRLHPLRGSYAGFYAVDVSGNWRIVFRFEQEHATDVDLVNYH